MQAAREDQLAKALKWSLFAHAAIFAAVILKSLVFPADVVQIAPSLRVDMVGLPDILKKDLSKVSRTVPKSAPKEEPAPEPVVKAPVTPVEATRPDELILHPKKSDKKPPKTGEKTVEKNREKKLQSALARIRALERLKDKSDDEEEDDAAVIIKGNQASKGSSLSGDAKESAQSGYYDLVREGLVEFWTLPPWLGRQKLSAQVLIRIDPSGRVLETKFVKKSGNLQFDDAILATIRDSQPLPRPPKELRESLVSGGVVVGFPL
ncbi:MAG: TonB family protein [Cryobacterium sp.]|nr:TonB family protein [Oligoflexia bacterium]